MANATHNIDDIETVAPDMPHRHPCTLGVFMCDLHKFLAALLVQFRNTQADDLPLRRRRQSEIGGHYGLLDSMHKGFVPDIDRNQP